MFLSFIFTGGVMALALSFVKKDGKQGVLRYMKQKQSFILYCA
jgi:hypothetical protein